jgi:uncharacterized protein
MQKEINYQKRYIEEAIEDLFAKKYSCLILGPRQVGKTTLIREIFRNKVQLVEFLLQDPSVRISLERDPGSLIRQIEAIGGKPWVFIDEAQKVPAIFDAIQYLIDENKAQFIITGSSARKLRSSGINLLPGRIKRYFLDPFSWGEVGFLKENNIQAIKIKNLKKLQDYSFEDSLVFGSLPKIASLPNKEREDFLRAYAEIYLEEEIRAEALSRKIGNFSRFLELAALESGTAPNLSKLSNESGVSMPTIKEYYNLLEDTLVAERVDPYLKNSRKRVLSSSRYYFFDLGVRNVLARLPLQKETINSQKGILFEHAVVLEIIRRIRSLNNSFNVYYWRTSSGLEVDLIIDAGSKLIPIEIKSSSSVSLSELRGLRTFLEDYKDKADVGYVITYGGNKEKLADNIISLPWNCL